MTLSRYGDHHFWSIIIVYFFFAWSFYHSPAFIAVPTCLYALPCSQLLRTPTDYSVPLLCPTNLFESAARKVFSLSSFPCHFLERKCTAPPQTQDEGSRRWASCPVAGLPALNYWCLPIQASLPSHFCFWVYSDRGCVCWFCREMKTSASLLVLILLSLCVVSSCFFFWNSFIHSFYLLLSRVFFPASAPSLAAGGKRLLFVAIGGFSWRWFLLLRSSGSRPQAPLVAARRLGSCGLRVLECEALECEHGGCDA